VAKSMKDSGTGGSIVNLSSVVGFRNFNFFLKKCSFGFPSKSVFVQASLVAMAKRTVYGGSKSALDQISKVMALELGPFNIR